MNIFIPNTEYPLIQKEYGIRSSETINNVPQISLPLKWNNYPEETTAFAITLIDYENMKVEGMIWVHWLIANIPGDISEIPVDFSRNTELVSNRIVQGKNSWITLLTHDDPICNRYGGPAPDLEKTPHSNEYEIQIYALNRFLSLEQGFYFNELRNELQDAMIDTCRLNVFYEV